MELNKVLINFDKLIKIFLLIMLFFPSINFTLYRDAEIFPWAIFAVIFLLKKIDHFSILIYLLLIINTLVTMLFLQDTSILFQSVRSLAAYLNVLMVFLLILKLPYTYIELLIKIIKILFIFLIIIGFLQMSGILEFLNPLFQFLIPRGLSYYTGGVRGISLFSIEPARAGIELIFIYIVYRMIFIQKRYYLLTDLFLLLYLLFFIRSAMAIGLYSVFLLLVYHFRLFFILVFSMIFIPLLDIDFSKIRATEVILSALAENSLSDALFYVVNTSGNRLVSIYTSFYYGILNPFGGGIGNWEQTSILALKIANIDVSNLNFFGGHTGNGDYSRMRSSGFMSNLIQDVGLILFLVIFYYIIEKLNKYWKISIDSKIIILFFFIKIFFIGSVGDPVAWVTIVIVLRYMYQKNLNESI